MAQYTELSAQLRTGTGKGFARKLKQQGKIPAILYGGQQDDSTMLSLDQSDLRAALKEGAGHSLIQMNISGDKKGRRLVMLKEIQNHPISRAIHHVDFLEVSEKQKVDVSIPIVLIGEAAGVKGEGGILEHILRKLNIECPANAIPENIEVDISELGLGSAIHVEDLVLDKKLTVKDDLQQTVVCVVAPKAEEEVVEELEEGLEGEEVAEGEKPAEDQETAESGE